MLDALAGVQVFFFFFLGGGGFGQPGPVLLPVGQVKPGLVPTNPCGSMSSLELSLQVRPKETQLQAPAACWMHCGWPTDTAQGTPV